MSHRMPRRGPVLAARPIAVVVAALAVLLGVALTTPAVQAEPAGRTAGRGAAVSFRVASFNLLGSNHTVRSKYWRNGKIRARMAREWLESERISVAGLQEGQLDQLRTLARNDRWQSYPTPWRATNSQTAQSVAWRRGTWSLVKAHTFKIPFDRNQVREQPVVLLQHRHTGRRIWVISAHMTAGGGKRGAMERRIGTRRLLDEVKELRDKKRPVVVTGDMNSHADFYCAVASQTDLHAANGGSFSRDGGCRPPSVMHVDWLFGSPSLQWSNLRFADGGVLDEITDHTVPVADVHLP